MMDNYEHYEQTVFVKESLRGSGNRLRSSSLLRVADSTSKDRHAGGWRWFCRWDEKQGA